MEKLQNAIKYEVSNGEAIVREIYTDMDIYYIPEYIDGYKVTELYRSALCCCEKIISVLHIPKTVTKIRGYGGLSTLKVAISKDNPAYCSTEDGVVYSKDMKTLVDLPYQYEDEYVIPEGVVSIGEDSSYSFSFAGGVVLPDSLKEINSCIHVDGKLIIPRNVKHIEEPFRFSASFFEVAQENCYYSNDEFGVLFNKNKSKLLKAPNGIKKYNIPDGVEEIEDFAFGSGLKEVNIPEGVKKIGCFNFTMVENLTLPQSVVSIGECICEFYFKVGKNVSEISKCLSCNNFPNCIDSENPYFKIYDGALYNKDKTRLLKVISSGSCFVVPEGVKTIDAFALSLDNCIEEIYLPSSVEYIGNYAFPLDVKKICVSPDNKNFCSDDGILYNKDMTVLIRYPGGRRGDYIMPNSVEHIGSGAFDCVEIDKFYVSDNLKLLYLIEMENVNEIYISANAKNLYLEQFCRSYNCRIYVEKNNPHYQIINGTLCCINESDFNFGLHKYPTKKIEDF